MYGPVDGTIPQEKGTKAEIEVWSFGARLVGPDPIPPNIDKIIR